MLDARAVFLRPLCDERAPPRGRSHIEAEFDLELTYRVDNCFHLRVVLSRFELGHSRLRDAKAASQRTLTQLVLSAMSQ